MDISFLHPAFLLLLLGIPALWFFPRRTQNVTHAVLRSLLFAALVLALARPVLLAADQTLFQVLILDRSQSVSPDKQAQGLALANEWFKQLKDKDKSSVIVIDQPAVPGANNGAQSSELTSLLAGAGTVIRMEASASSSSISAALAAAQRQISDDSPGTITLLSDGLSTDRRWGPIVQTLIQRGIAVNTADLSVEEGDVYPAAIRVQPVLRAGQTANVDVQIIGRAQNIQVRLLDEGGRQLAAATTANSDGRVRVPLEFEPAGEGFMTIRAEITAPEGADSNPNNNSVQKTIAVQPSIRMLYLGERMLKGADHLESLLGRGFKVTDGSKMDLNAPPDLHDYDLVVVDDRSVTLMPESFQERLAQAVSSQGIGMIFSGGKSSFGTGGYDQTTLAKALPIEFIQRTEKRDPSTALALVVDTSGSMIGAKMEMARQVARLAVRRLKAHDRIGIVEFYGNRHWALPMQSAANKITIDRALGRMQAVGGTELYPAVEEAYYGLKNVITRYKHILIITDALVESSDFEALVRRVSKDRINVSTVAVGALTPSPLMEDLAVWGEGQYYQVIDSYGLPELVLKQPSTMKLPAYKTGNFPVNVRGGEGWWGALNRSSIPQLSGYVETKVRPGAEVLMEIEANAHPVLATWQYGLGRVTAFMTEPVGDGTAGWQQWRDYGRMLARIATRTADAGRAFHYTIERNDHRVIVTAKRLTVASTVLPQASIVDAEGQERAALAFTQQAPDLFSAETVVAPDEEIRVQANARNLTEQGNTQPVMRLVSMSREDVAAEQQVDPETALDMEGLALATNGVSLDPAAPAAASFIPPAQQSAGALSLTKLWPYCLLLALLLYVGELTYRRWPSA